MKKRKKHSIRKKNICHKCGQPPSERDNEMLNKFQGVWQCSECLVGGYDDEADIRERAENEVWGGSCPLGDDSALPSEAYYTCEEKKNVTANMEKHKIKSYSYRDGNNGLYK